MFTSARLKMAAWYTLILAVIVAFFSLLVYANVMSQFQTIVAVFERNLWMARHAPTPPFFRDPEAFRAHLELVRQTVVVRLVVIDIAILLLGAAAGYFLAGKTMQPIRNALEEQKRFVADAAHELRTPLTSLRTSIEVALREKRLTAKDARAALESNLEDVESLEALVEDLLTLARYEKGVPAAGFQPVDLAESCRAAARHVRHVAEARGLRFEEHLEPVVLEADEKGLQKLVSVLLDNAIKYTERGSITLSCGQAGKYAVIEVSDTGAGIAPDDLPRIFERFYRADTARTRDASHSYGLGLSIARKIVDLHRGTITVSSEPGKGSVFTVRLPLKQS